MVSHISDVYPIHCTPNVTDLGLTSIGPRPYSLLAPNPHMTKYPRNPSTVNKEIRPFQIFSASEKKINTRIYDHKGKSLPPSVEKDVI